MVFGGQRQAPLRQEYGEASRALEFVITFLCKCALTGVDIHFGILFWIVSCHVQFKNNIFFNIGKIIDIAGRIQTFNISQSLPLFTLAQTEDELSTEEELLTDDELLTEEELSSDDELLTEEELSTEDELLTEEELSTEDELLTEEELSTEDELLTEEELSTEEELPSKLKKSWLPQEKVMPW